MSSRISNRFLPQSPNNRAGSGGNGPTSTPHEPVMRMLMETVNARIAIVHKTFVHCHPNHWIFSKVWRKYSRTAVPCLGTPQNYGDNCSRPPMKCSLSHSHARE